MYARLEFSPSAFSVQTLICLGPTRGRALAKKEVGAMGLGVVSFSLSSVGISLTVDVAMFVRSKSPTLFAVGTCYLFCFRHSVRQRDYSPKFNPIIVEPMASGP